MRRNIIKLALLPMTAAAFVTHARLRFPTTALDMVSSLTKKRMLPPPPEDQITITGDVATLFLYTFLDHGVNDMYSDALQTSDISTFKSLDPYNEFGISSIQLPVWFDGSKTLIQKEQIMAVLSVPHMDYAPLLQTAGISSIVLTGVWLICGWFSGAFLFKNTLSCHTSRMLSITGKTWLVTAIIMVCLAYSSDIIVNSCLHTTPLGGLTKADANFIFDSLTVIIIWRFLISIIFGGGTRK